MYELFEISRDQHTSYNKLHFLDTTPLNLSVSEYGIQNFKHIIPVGIHSIEGYSLHYIMSGKGVVNYSNKTSFHCEKGDIIITYPNIPVQFIPDKHDAWEYFYIMFNSNNILELLEAANFSHTKPIYKTSHQEEIDELISNLSNNHYSRQVNRLRVASTLLQIMSLIIEEQEKNINSFKRVDKELYIQKTFQVIEENYMNPQFRVEHICKELNISYSYLSQLFREVGGYSIISYIKNYRMREARLLLDNGELICNVAYKCGYNSAAHFTKEFKSMFKITPKQYREKLRNI